MKSFRDISLFPMLLSIGACQLIGQDKNGSQIDTIKNGYFFGECVGLCAAELVIQEDQRVFSLREWISSEPAEQYEGDLSPNNWVNIQNKINLDEFCDMEDVYGCPDCADGGGEYIIMECEGVEKRVTFEFASTDLEEINELLTLIRPLRFELEPNGRF